MFRVLIALLLALFVSPTSTSAHERRDIAGGKYQFVIGFIGEPALLGEPNGIDLRITTKADNKPFEGADKTLKATIAYGGGTPKPVTLRARFGMPGAYTADVLPTRPGAYIFTFTGDLEGAAVNERFESGPGRFSEVEATTNMQFPEVVPDTGTLARQLNAAEQRIGQATTFAYAGIAVGILGALLGVVALMRRPRAA